MKITKKETEALTYLLTVEIERAEANEKKDKQLKEYRKKAELKGFRKGMAPMGLIEKMYGPAALNDAVNSLISDGINNYINEQKLDLIGEPIPADELQKEFDIEKDTKFEFVYEMGLRPAVDVVFDKKDKVINYDIKVTPDALEQYKSDMLRQFGNLEDVAKSGDEDFLIVDLEQGEKRVEKAYITLKGMDAKIKKLFLGKKVGDSFDVDTVKAFPNDADRASLLRIKKDEFDASNPIYKLTVKEVKSFVPAKESQELYDRMFGKDKVKDSAGFEKALEEKLKADYATQSDFRLRRDIIDYAVKKAGLALPENFLKKWLFRVNEEKFTMEQIEREFPLFLQDFRWQLITKKIFDDQKMKITKEDMLNVAKEMTATQFAMYGMGSLPEDMLKQYAEQMLSDQKQVSRVFEKCEENKVLAHLKEAITIDNKSITQDELAKINEKAAKAADKEAAKAEKSAKTEKKSTAKKSTKKSE